MKILFVFMLLSFGFYTLNAQSLSGSSDGASRGRGFSYNVEISIKPVAGGTNNTLHAGAYIVKLISVSADSKGYFSHGKSNRYYSCSELGSFCTPNDFTNVYIGLNYQCKNSGTQAVSFTKVNQEQTITFRLDPDTKCSFKLQNVRVLNNKDEQLYRKRINEIEYPQQNKKNTDSKDKIPAVTVKENAQVDKLKKDKKGKDGLIKDKGESGQVYINGNIGMPTNSKSTKKEDPIKNKSTQNLNSGPDAQTAAKIGTQLWSNKNLNVASFKNGDAIPEVSTKEAWINAGKEGKPAWCYYNDDPKNGEKYGKLYNWYAVTDPRGLAPNGWHIPSDSDWPKLIDHLGGEDVAGTKMKSKDGWQNNGNGNNESEFSGLPGGYRDYNGLFDANGFMGTWWSSTEENTTSAWFYDLNYSYEKAFRKLNLKIYGYSVRCLRD